MKRGGRKFITAITVVTSLYVSLLVAMVLASVVLIVSAQPNGLQEDATHNLHSVLATLARPEIKQSILLSLGTSIVSAVISVWIGTAIAYLISRFHFPGRQVIDFILDLPIFLPPLVIGIVLLILFRRTPLSILDDAIGIAFHVPAIVLAQTVVGSAFVYRTMKATFDALSPRQEELARSLGCSRYEAFHRVTLPQARSGLVTAAAIAWARSFGEFGPVLVFAGSIRGRTEVMPVSIYLELNSGNLTGAVLIALIMIAVAALVLTVARLVGAQLR